MPDRHAQIVVLLDTMHDHLPTFVRHTHTAAGFVHETETAVSCPDCLANSRTMFGCVTCGGRGYTLERRSRDPYAVDHVTPYGLAESAGERERTHHATIARLDAQTRAPWSTELDALEDANQHPYGWEIARRRMYARFDYRALDVALDLLRAAMPSTPARSSRGLSFLEPWMPDPIRSPRAVVVVNVAARGPRADRRALEQRDAAVRAMLAEGARLDEVAAQVGLSARQLRRIQAA